MKIILDTNFLLIPAQFNIDIFTEIHRICDFKYELFVLDKTISELKGIIADKSQKLKNKKAARLALQLIKVKKVKALKTYSAAPVDNILIELADKDTIIATQDIDLKRKIKNKAKIIILRAKKRLVLV